MTRPPRIAHIATVDLSVRFLFLNQLVALRDLGAEVYAISAGGPWVQAVEAAGVEHILWPHATRRMDPRADLIAFAELCKILRRGQFDLIHTHTPKPGVLGRLGGRLCGVPCIANSVHGFYATHDDPILKRGAVLGVEGIAARFSDLEFYDNREDQRWALRRHVSSQHKSHWLGQGADVERFDPALFPAKSSAELRASLGVAADSVMVTTVARLSERKGIREFVAAATLAATSEEHVQFVIVGGPDPGGRDPVTIGEIEDTGPNVIVTGYREDLPELLAATDLFVLASHWEGMPIAAVQAGAMAKPRILTRVRGTREIATDGMDALYVPSRDPAALSQAVVSLARAPARAAELGRAARATTVDEYSLQAVLRRLVSGYAQAGRGRASQWAASVCAERGWSPG